jgi:hypothetical protein
LEYLKLFENLYKEEIEYLVCGGLAVNIYGIPRMTADIDLIINFTEENIKKFEEVIKRIRYAPRLPISLGSLLTRDSRLEAVKNKNLVAFSFYNYDNSYMELDVLIDVPFAFGDMWKDRMIRPLGNINVNLVSLDHLIALKKYSNRAQDQNDIILLSKLKNEK